MVAEVKALACELPATSGVPLSRWSMAELAAEVVLRGVVAAISAATIWRWLIADAIRPWFHRSWIFPRYAEICIAGTMPSSELCGVWPAERVRVGDLWVRSCA